MSLKCSNYESYCVSNVSIFHNFFSHGFPSFFTITIHHRLSKFTVSSPQTLTYCRSWGGPALGPPIGRKSGFVRLFLARLRLGRLGRHLISDAIRILYNLDVFDGLSIVCLIVWYIAEGTIASKLILWGMWEKSDARGI